MNTFTDAAPDPGGPPPSRRPIRAVAVSIGLTVIALVVSVAGSVALVIPVLVFGLDFASVTVLLGLTAAGQLGFVLVAYGYARYADLRVRVEIPGRRDLLYIGGGLVAALAVAVGLSTLLAILGLAPGSVIEEAAIRDPTLLLGLAVLSIALVAPAEELLFRGVIQGRLRRAFGPKGAIVGAGLLFGSLHLANFTGAVWPIVAGALLISAVGGVLGLIYERTGNLTVPIVTHGIYNTVLFGIAFLTI